MAKIISVCRSDRKGISKSPVSFGVLEIGIGLVDDAHAGSSANREVSLLAMESIEKINSEGFHFKPGDFAENLTTGGIELITLRIGTHLQIGKEAMLEITQIGKKCHTGCAIYQEAGKCIMPREGIFARVIHGGLVKPEDKIQVLDKPFETNTKSKYI